MRAYVERHAAVGQDACGAFGHPSPAGAYHATPTATSSHVVTSLRWDGPQLRGTLALLPTPGGAQLLHCFLSGADVGVSTRGWAQLAAGSAGAPSGVVCDFQLVAFDVVPCPATPGARLWPLLQRAEDTGGAQPLRLLPREDGASAS